MANGKLLQFPVRNPDLFSREINYQVLSNSEFNGILYAAIRALPHVKNVSCREELKRALCDLLLRMRIGTRTTRTMNCHPQSEVAGESGMHGVGQ
jgi:hypothetical protein